MTKLRKDPSLRLTEAGRATLRLLDAHTIDDDGWDRLVASVPDHCAQAVVDLARQCVSSWDRFVDRLEVRGPGRTSAPTPRTSSTLGWHSLGFEPITGVTMSSQGETVEEAPRRGIALVRWAAPLIGSLLMAAALLTFRAPPGWLWLWLVFGASTLCWGGWVMLFGRFPTAGLALLALASAIPATVADASADGTAVILTCIALATFASRPEPRTFVISALLVFDAALIVLNGVLGGHSPGSWFGNVGAAVIVVLIGINRRHHGARVAQAERLLSQERQIHAEQLRGATLDERARIAREIHDVVAHSLGALRVQLEVMQTLLTEQHDVDRALRHLALSQSLTIQGLADARDAVAALRDDVRPLPDALADLVAAFGRDHEAPAKLEVRGTPRPVRSGGAIALLRVGREALTNIGKHAAAGGRVSIELDYEDDEVRLCVRSELGAPATGPRASGEYGLTGMRERIELVDGTLEAGPAGDGSRWEVLARIPAPGQDDPTYPAS